MMKKGLLNGRSSYKSDSDKGLNKKPKYISQKSHFQPLYGRIELSSELYHQNV